MKEILLDISSVCPHACIYCYHQNRKLSKNILMTPEMFALIAPIIIKEKYQKVHLYMSGESFLNPYIYDYLEFFGSWKREVEIATKFAVKIDFDKLKECVQIFTDNNAFFRLIIEIDGASEEVLKPIAVVNLELLKSNLKNLRALITKGSYITVQFRTIVNSYNEKDIQKIKSLIQSSGFSLDLYKTKDMGLYKLNKMDSEEVKTIIPKTKSSKRVFTRKGKVSFKEGCRFTKRASISPEGNVTICCHDMLYEVNCGNVLETGSIDAILLSNKFKEMRCLGKARKLSICKGCN